MGRVVRGDAEEAATGGGMGVELLGALLARPFGVPYPARAGWLPVDAVLGRGQSNHMFCSMRIQHSIHKGQSGAHSSRLRRVRQL
jgi:hypothetical protein